MGLAIKERKKLVTDSGHSILKRMQDKATHDPILARFHAILKDLYGSELDRVVLFGSRARGDAYGNSDYDIAVFLKALPDRWSELDRLAELRVMFLDDAGVFFDAMPYPAAAYFEHTPLMREIRREGKEL